MTIITVTVTKETEESKLGIAFTRANVESPLMVKMIREGGLFEPTELKAGMVVGDIQGVTMTWKTPKEAAELLKSAPAGEVSVTSPVFVGEITKESPDVKLGISLKNSSKAPGIFISKISEESLFAGTELAPGQQVLLINGAPCPETTKDAIEMVKAAPDTLKIVAVPVDLVQPEAEDPPAAEPVEAAPMVEEKKEEIPEEPVEEEEKPKEMTPVEPEEEQEEKGLVDKLFASCMC